MSEHEEKVQQFIAITGVNQDRANFFLESAAWDVEIAMSRYYENDADDVIVSENNQQQLEETQQTMQTSKGTSRQKKSSNFATINTITTSSDEEEEGQAYYAGGSEHSGQQVLGPPKKRDIVADMFKSVQEHGVEVLESGAGSSSSRSFRGPGYKLGQNTDDTEVIPGASEPSTPQEVTFRLWQNGFTVNDGDLRLYTDPANREFLSSVQKGEIPQELRQGNTEIYLAMEDHRQEQYKPSKNKRVKPFEGQGYTLGSPAPTVVGSCSDDDKAENEATAKEKLKLDNSKPTTSIQIRLADGTRLVGQFNHEHTVGEVRSYITAARPQYETRPFNLISTYPSKVLDDAETLKDAGLLNAAVMQKLI